MKKTILVLLVGGLVAAPLAQAKPTRAERNLKRRAADLRRFGPTPRGALSLYGLSALRPRLPRAAYAGFLKRAVRLRLHPLTRDVLRFVQLTEARAAGRTAEARKLRQELGLPRALWVVGPFDNEGGAGARRRFGPELRPGAPLRTDRTWVGKGATVGWRRLPAVFPSGILRPAAFMEAGESSVVYLRTDLQVPRAGVAALRLGTNGDYRVWLNGALVADRTVRRPLRPDQDAVGIRLRQGRNTLLIKLSAEGRAPQAMVRVTAAKGGPLRGLTFLEPKRGHGSGVTVLGRHGKPVAGPRVTTLQGTLEAAIKRRPKDPALLRDLARFHRLVHPDDPRKEHARSWAEKWRAQKPSAAAWRMVAACSRTADEQRRALEAALKVEVRDALAHLQLGELAVDAGYYARARRHFRRALALDPGLVRAGIKLAELAQLQRMPAAADRRLQDLARTHGQREDLRLARAALAIDRGQQATAQRILAAHVARRATDLASLARLANLARRRLKPDRVQHWLRAQIAARPDWLRPRIALAHSLAVNGKPQQGLRVVQQALSLAPAVFRLYRALGNVALRGGLRAAARRAYTRALAIRPQALQVKRLLSYLERRGPDPLVKRWAKDARALARAAWKARGTTEDAEVLLDTTAYHVLPSGLARRFQQRIVHIHTRKGVAAWREFDLDYLPDTQQLEVRVARVIRPDGSEVEARQHDVQLSDPAIRMYYDRRVKVIRFAGLRPGDVIELQTLLADIPASNAFKDYFGTILPLQASAPIRHLQVAVSLPANRRIRFNRPALPGLRHVTRREKGRVLHLWEVHHVKAVQDEPQMPGWAETHAHLLISTFQTWREVARWYWGLVKEQYYADADLRRAAHQAVAGKRTLRDKVLAIYHLVVTKTRYVSLAFGMHTYKPYSAPQVFARKFGDCKDKAMLMAVMLKEVGITGYPVLVRTRRGGRLEKQPPSLAVFDHAILYVPRLRLWLDGTAERTGANEFPWADQGMIALIIDGKDGQLVQTPVQPARANRIRRRLDLRLRPDGSADVTDTWTITGQEARWWRTQFTDPATRATTYEKLINRVFPQAKVSAITLSDPDALERPVHITAVYRVPGLASGDKARWRVDLSLSEDPLTSTYAPLSKRTHPVLYHYPFDLQVEIHVRWPKAWRFEAGPPATHVRVGGTAKAPAAAADQQVTHARGRLTLKRRLTLRQVRWPVRDYASLRRFWTQVDQALQPNLRLTPRSGGAR